MSSHHIVREKQEPALLVLGLHEFSYEMLGQLLEWSPTVIATMETAAQLNADQIKVDWLISNDIVADLQSNIKLLSPGDESYLEFALKQLVIQGYPAVNIITDEFSVSPYLFYTNKIDLVVYTSNEKIYPVKSGFSKWKPAGETIKIINKLSQLSLTGLKIVQGAVYETTHDGFFTLQFSQPYIFLSELI